MHPHGVEHELHNEQGAFGEDARARYCEPSANPHSAVANPGSSFRIWNSPIAVSRPAGTTPKLM